MDGKTLKQVEMKDTAAHTGTPSAPVVTSLRFHILTGAVGWLSPGCVPGLCLPGSVRKTSCCLSGHSSSALWGCGTSSPTVSQSWRAQTTVALYSVSTRCSSRPCSNSSLVRELTTLHGSPLSLFGNSSHETKSAILKLLLVAP